MLSSDGRTLIIVSIKLSFIPFIGEFKTFSSQKSGWPDSLKKSLAPVFCPWEKYMVVTIRFLQRAAPGQGCEGRLLFLSSEDEV